MIIKFIHFNLRSRYTCHDNNTYPKETSSMSLWDRAKINSFTGRARARAREKKTKRQPAITNACVRRVGSQLLLFITADLRFTVSGAR